jgi:mono/diheme cytochrome c family protein
MSRNRPSRPKRRAEGAKAVFAAALACFLGPLVRDANAQAGPSAGLEQGRKLYEKYCSQCHGEAGDGKGVAAPYLKPAPRDFTSGKFKIRSTESGQLPTDEDLARIVRVGMPYTSMPGWTIFTDAEIRSLVEVVKSFSPAFANPDNKPTPVELPEPPRFSEESASKGRKIYDELGCAGCHGEAGRGDGPSAPSLRDDWGQHIRPADLTKPWTFRGGPTRRDIFRAFSTGLNGTPMPSYAGALDIEQRWHLVDYIWSLSRTDRPGYAEMVTARKLGEAIPLEGAGALFERATPARFPIVGQIMEPGREFHPSAVDILVRAVYNETEIAFELRWNDMRAETSGHNGPDLPVPPDEEARAAGPPAPPAPEGESDFWGEAATPSEGALAGPDPTVEFSDAVALQFPYGKVEEPKKPYFLFGDSANPVDIWFFDLAKKAPEQFIGRGSRDLASQGQADLEAIARYDRGEWTVIFKRTLRVMGGVPFEEGAFVPIAFSVWDGFNRERGNKRGLTGWFYVHLEPGGPRSAFGPAVRVGSIALAIEAAIVVALRRRRARAAPARVPEAAVGEHAG